MSVEVFVTCEGGVDCQAQHGPSGASLHTTAPIDNGGDGTKYSPTDLVGTALATCVVTMMALAARRHGVDLAGTTARVEKHMSKDSPRRIVGLPLHVEVSVAVPDRLRGILEKAARACPVHRSLAEGIEAPVTITWAQP